MKNKRCGTRNHKTVLRNLVSVVFWLTSTSAIQGAIIYTPIDLSPSGFDGFGSEASGISAGQQVGFAAVTDNYWHAMLWSGSAESYVDLHPSGFTRSYIYGTSGTQQVGHGDWRALMWAGTAESCTVLHPGDFEWSWAVGTDGLRQVGFGHHPDYPGNLPHALLWNGTAKSYVDLNPAGFTQSRAHAISGVQQVGQGSPSGQYSHALLWNGSADNYIDLHPGGDFGLSVAVDLSGAEQVGYGFSLTSDHIHALVWHETAESFVDLHPQGFTESSCLGTNGIQQVGYGNGLSTADNDHALLWTGSATSCLDLHFFLPGFFVTSRAVGIDANGNVVGYGVDNTGLSHAILWQVPEPSSMALIGLGLLALMKRK